MGTLTAGVLALVSCAIAPGLLFYFDVTPKIAVVLVGAALALPRLLIHARARGRFVVLLAAFWLSLAISTLLSQHPDLSMGGSNWRRLGLITWTAILVFGCVTSQLGSKSVLLVIRATAVSGGAAAVYGIFQYFGLDPWLSPELYRVGEGEWTIVRPPGPLGYVTYFATYLVATVFAGVALMGEERRGWRIAGSCCAGLAMIAIILSGTRAALAGVAAGALLLFILSRPRLGFRAGAAAVLVAAGAALFYYSPAGQQLRSRTRWYVEDPAGGARLWLWRDTATLVRRNWAAGIGPESFPREFPRFQSAELSRRFPDFYHESPHNIFLDVLAAQGVVGLLVLLAAIGVALRAGMGARWRHALVSALIALLVTQQFSSFTAPTALLLFVCLGLLAASEERHPAAARRRPLVAALAAPVSAVLLILAVRLVVADHLLNRTRSAISQNRLTDAVEHYRSARAWGPAGFGADIWYARTLASAAQRTDGLHERQHALQDAMVAAARAVNSADDPQNAWYNLAVFFGIQNDAAGAEQALRRAIEISPNWYKPRWMLAQVLRHAGRFEEAGAEAALAADLNGGKTLEVLRTAEQIRAEAGSRRSEGLDKDVTFPR